MCYRMLIYYILEDVVLGVSSNKRMGMRELLRSIGL